MTIHCPCCGHTLTTSHAPLEALDAAPLSLVRRAIVQRLAQSYPRSVPADEIIAHVYRGAREPENARGALSVQLANLRLQLRSYGWTIPRAQGGRGNLAFYKLEPLSCP